MTARHPSNACGSIVGRPILNDAGFWLFKEYFNASVPDTFRCWTAMETIVSLVGLVGVLVLARAV